MTVSKSDTETSATAAVQRDEMDWHAYAEHYDEMCALNPAYQQNIQALIDRLSLWKLPSDARVCDLGAGTGNYISALSRFLPHGSFVHVDFDRKMNELARHKYARQGIVDVNIVEEHVQHVDFPTNSFDLVVCVNALYAISPQREVLTKIRRWLRPNGKFFVIDFGRKQRTLDWTLYILRESVRSNNLRRYAKALVEAREVLKQNRRSTRGQTSGRYWLHSTEEFRGTLESCGYKVIEVFPCYRGYADLAVCETSLNDESKSSGNAPLQASI